jgi:hypothetical protein
MTRTPRYAVPAGLAFVSQDGDLRTDVIVQKFAERELIVAEQEGVPVGFARIERLWSSSPYLTLIRVRPQYNAGGIDEIFFRKMLDEPGRTVPGRRRRGPAAGGRCFVAARSPAA